VLQFCNYGLPFGSQLRIAFSLWECMVVGHSQRPNHTGPRGTNWIGKFHIVWWVATDAPVEFDSNPN